MSDGGPAFPLPFTEDTDLRGDRCYTTADDIGHGGMSLRDYFAGQALAGFVRSRWRGATLPAEAAAAQAYRYADAMLAERAK
jgi:hypothetical protein